MSGATRRWPSRWRPHLVAALLSAWSLALAAVVGLWLHDAPGPVPGVDVPLWALGIAFVAAELLTFSFEFGEEAKLIALGETVAALAIVAQHAAAILAVRAGAFAVVELIRVVRTHRSVEKLLFNVTACTAEAAVMLAVVQLLVERPDVTSPNTWGAIVAAAAVASVYAAVPIALVVAAFDGRLAPRVLRRTTASSALIEAIAAGFGVVGAVLISAAPYGGLLAAGLALTGLAAYRGHGALRDRTSQLGALHTFTSRALTSTQVDDPVMGIARDVAVTMHARSAEVWLADWPGLPGGRRVRVTADGDVVEVAAEHAWLQERLADGQVIHASVGDSDPVVRRYLAAAGWQEALVVALPGGPAHGAVAVGDRRGRLRGFAAEDARMFATVGRHAATLIDNARLVAHLRHVAVHDPTTGSGNRLLVAEALEGLLSRGDPAAVIVLDLLRFHEVNENLGVAAGDVVLREVGRRLEAATSVAEGAVVARMAGDEFAVVVPGIGGVEDGLEVTEQIHRWLRPPVLLGDVRVPVEANVGLAVLPLHAATPAEVVQRAEAALFDGKHAGDPIRVYDATRDAAARERLALLADLRDALDGAGNHLLYVEHQPQIRVRDGAVAAVETLARWVHPVHGRVGPDVFVPLAESTGLIGALTHQVLEAALEDVIRWRRALPDLRVSVNLSARSLVPSLVDSVGELLSRVGAPASALTLEITESVLVADPRHSAEILTELHAAGARISVDDFGTGYSSLSYLSRLPVDEVKIDRSFVKGMHTDRGDAAVVRAVGRLGEELGLDVVAEGVERLSDLPLLAAAGVTVAQGYGLARPMGGRAVDRWLEGYRPVAVVAASLPTQQPKSARAVM